MVVGGFDELYNMRREGCDWERGIVWDPKMHSVSNIGLAKHVHGVELHVYLSSLGDRYVLESIVGALTRV